MGGATYLWGNAPARRATGRISMGSLAIGCEPPTVLSGVGSWFDFLEPLDERVRSVVVFCVCLRNLVGILFCFCVFVLVCDALMCCAVGMCRDRICLATALVSDAIG
ncbi:hypothetical protein [uncultured Tateyamaria sp.]|uniref:hypothetical protein n=1 Tax=uncultured Tateyamaria sp. TaxID=455651 RepID=UPI002633296E|nr:hypothetical protein [uncultured Tateyamaria sp.]